MKHAALARVLAYLMRKEAPFRVLDTHAGAGLYDLDGANALRTGEADTGIETILNAELPVHVAELLTPYLNAVRSLRSGGGRRYPGSPALALSLSRPQDRFLFCELHPEERAKLERRLGDDHRAKVLAQDGYQAIGAHLPPRERRGLVLIDPPFEEPGEFHRMVTGLEAAYRRFATGIFMLWYPIKDLQAVDRFRCDIASLGLPKTLRIELDFAEVRSRDVLSGSGLIIVNPPFTLADEMRTILSAISPMMARDGKGRVRVSWITGE